MPIDNKPELARTALETSIIEALYDIDKYISESTPPQDKNNTRMIQIGPNFVLIEFEEPNQYSTPDHDKIKDIIIFNKEGQKFNLLPWIRNLLGKHGRRILFRTSRNMGGDYSIEHNYLPSEDTVTIQETLSDNIPGHNKAFIVLLWIAGIFHEIGHALNRPDLKKEHIIYSYYARTSQENPNDRLEEEKEAWEIARRILNNLKAHGFNLTEFEGAKLESVITYALTNYTKKLNY